MTAAIVDAGGIKICEGDRRYAALCRGLDPRRRARPDYIRLVSDSAQVRHALEQAVNEPVSDPSRTRIAVRSGGHCHEDACGEDVRVVIDMSLMDDVHHDPAMDAVCVEAGATDGDLRKKLWLRTGKVMPGGSFPSAGIGGHVPAGGFGLLSRQHGLTVDHLYAVEVAVVGRDRRVRLVTATRDSRDEHLRELWWAHTGGGGGNFGISTRFWFRDLPDAPERVLFTAGGWKWADIDKERFARIVGNFGRFFAEHRRPGGPYDPLSASLQLTHRSQGAIRLIAQIDAGVPGARDLLARFLAAVDEDVGVRRRSLGEPHGCPTLSGLHTPVVLPWDTVERLLGPADGMRAGKHKSAYMVRPLPDEQVETLWRGLAEDVPGVARDAVVQIDSYGGAINRPAPGETAVMQRSSILRLHYQVHWPITEQGEGHLRWIRELYRSMYAATGGVPLPAFLQDDPVTDGCCIGHPDADLDDPAWNASDVPWWRLYYGRDYRRLQRVKERWDPLDVFRHPQSVRLP
ncbi:FAD-binding oxidoreductase [Thermomonospora catenispora]|uniref:FAD-binding oxidoreductase n=1 Tax=Thermomonospora catenispora TaxID=2493090 RepID=UPI001121C0CF|nr:FAD-binding oxidoreductase [Thermomonospora catenispora]TNY34641.1 FAD-binding oxidoreductase [Thermomonospora catenispora]